MKLGLKFKFWLLKKKITEALIIGSIYRKCDDCSRGNGQVEGGPNVCKSRVWFVVCGEGNCLAYKRKWWKIWRPR